jgi:hypothetical protein
MAMNNDGKMTAQKYFFGLGVVIGHNVVGEIFTIKLGLGEAWRA